MADKPLRIGVAVPCYKVRAQVLDVLARMPAQIARIYVVDDDCPEGSGALVRQCCADPRVTVIAHAQNQGVGGAVITAYEAALADGMDIVVKVDGDGQMDPALIAQLVRPLIRRKADYAKGNRFYRPESLRGMPVARLIGNAGLSFINKLSTGYWGQMDPTNGFTAIHAQVLRRLPLDRLERRYFFESDLLYHLGIIRAVVHDVPMDAVYQGAASSLRVTRALPEFLVKHAARFLRRYGYMYWLRDFNLGSLYSLAGLLLCAAGGAFGAMHWVRSADTGQPATGGTVMAAALPFLIGIQCLIAFLHHDVSHTPSEPLIQDLLDADGLA